jgi:hypothetical protein
MSAALQLPVVSESSSLQAIFQESRKTWNNKLAVQNEVKPNLKVRTTLPEVSLAFYRRHTESMLRRYLYASMQVGRSPSIFSDPVSRGWASSRPVRTFEDAIIFVLDIENCLNKLGSLDRQMLSRIVLQEYTQAEAATLLGMCVRTISYKFPQALDRLTEKLLEAGLLVLPH